MLKDLTREDWLSILNIQRDRIPRALILRGTRNLKLNYEKHRALFEDILEVGSPNGIFEDILIGRYRGVEVAYASVYGDAMASEVTHVFGVLGTSLVIQTGCCGALRDDIPAGDIVCAITAHCGEGAAQYYLPGKQTVEVSSELVESLSRDSVLPVALHKGPIWTTSALLAEGKKEIAEWSADGYIAVDMETAATFAVAEYFGMKRLSLLFVFDSPCLGDHVALTDKAKQERRHAGEQAMTRIALSLIAGSEGQY
jgi:purine-nucleoside phosphorylase